MRLAQRGVCAICHRPETATLLGKPTRLRVDHDHKDGHIRGLLCNKCNAGIAQLGDDPDTLLAAAEYLRRTAVVGG